MSYVPKRKPWKHQAEALEKLKGQKVFALFMAMRTGKTKITLDDWGRLQSEGKCNNLMVVAPGGVYKTWQTAIEDHLPAELLNRIVVHCWQSGAGSNELKKLEYFLNDIKKPRIFLINIEALSSVKMAREASKRFLKDAMIVIDESTAIKNPKAKRTIFINTELARLAKYKRILTGLPTPRSPLDIYSQFEFLDPDILNCRSYYAFRARYAIVRNANFAGRSVPVVVGYQNIEYLNELIAPYTFRKRLEDCYDLPAKTYIRRTVTMTDDQKRLYSDMKKYATTQLASMEHITATVVITQMLRLHQILCGHVRDEQGNFHEVAENRVASLLELLEEYDGSAIIWCSYDADIHKIEKALKKEYGEGSVARFWGGNIKTREQEEKNFLNDPECRFMIATPAAGGRGRTWLKADMVIYYSSTNNLEHRSQSEERAQGVNKTRSVVYVDLLTEGTVEEKIIKSLREKIDMAAMITGDNYQEWLI